MQGSALAIAIIAAVLATTALSACDMHSQTVNSTTLQQDIAERLEHAGQKPESVRCIDDLKGEVGYSVRCEVVIAPTNAIEPIITVTKVDDEKVTYELTPALSQSQLEKHVADLVGAHIGIAVHSVSCETGIQGVVGNEKHCTVQDGTGRFGVVVTVTQVDGLLMDFSVNRA